MSDFPERISISPVHRQKRDDDFYLVDRKAFPGKGTEYIRADLIEARVAAADALAEAVDNHSNMVCQDFGLQLELGLKVDEALAAYQATKEGE